MTEYWPEGHEKSLNNDFNAVPISLPPKKPKRDRSKKARAHHYKKDESKVDKRVSIRLTFDKEMLALLTPKTGAFCPHIPTRDENDRTNSIRMMK